MGQLCQVSKAQFTQEVGPKDGSILFMPFKAVGYMSQSS